MRQTLVLSLALGTLCAAAGAQKGSDCQPTPVISNGVCIDKNGKDCSSRETQTRICYAPDPQYTQEALKANAKGIVRLTATVGTNGCAADIKVVSSLGYGLDESAVFALKRFRFRQPAKTMSISVEFDFDPQLSSRTAVTASKCQEVADRAPPQNDRR
jgi:TonB family protein